MVRLLKNVAIVGAFLALSLIAVGLMVGTMDATASATTADIDSTDHAAMTSVPVKPSVLIKSEEEVTEPPASATDLQGLETRVKTLETDLCLLKLDQPRRVEALVNKLQARRQEVATKVVQPKCEECPTCKAAAAKQPVVATAKKPVVPARPAPRTVVQPAPTAWRPVNSSYGYSEEYRERRFFGRR